MPRQPQTSRYGAPDQAAGPGHQHAHGAARGRGGRILRSALLSGTVASLLSTFTVSLLSAVRSGSASAGTNATSQWVWGEPARRRRGLSLRHTLTGYLIHHASSVFWACGYQRWTRGGQRPVRRLGKALAVAAVAYAVDYHVVPRRLSPGFEHRLPRGGLALTYAAFAVGLWLGTPAADRRRSRRRRP